MLQNSIDFNMLTTDLLLFPIGVAVPSSQEKDIVFDEVVSPGIPSRKTLKTVFSPLGDHMRNLDSVWSVQWKDKYRLNGDELQIWFRLQLTHNCTPDSKEAVVMKEQANRSAEKLLVQVLDHLGRVSGSSLPTHVFLPTGEQALDSRPNAIEFQHRESADIARNFLREGKIVADKIFRVGNEEFVLPRVLNTDSSRHPFGEPESLKFRVSFMREMHEGLFKADTDIRLNNKTGIPVFFSEASIMDARARGLIVSETDLQRRRVHVLARRSWPSVFIQGDLHVSYYIDKVIELLE